MNKKIALDLDEVVASFYITALEEIINPYFGTDLKPDEWLSYHINEVINSIYGKKLEKKMSPNDFNTLLKEYSGNGFLENLTPVQDAIETIYMLESEGFDISYLTFRSLKFYNNVEEGTKKWMQKYNLNPKKVYFTSDKSKKMDELGINTIVEDMPYAALDIANKKRALLFSYPWNSKTEKDNLLNKKTREEKHNIVDKIELNENIIRVYNWQEIYFHLTNGPSDINNFDRIDTINFFD
jgi:uncharacterized HAD superfamily protein